MWFCRSAGLGVGKVSLPETVSRQWLAQGISNRFVGYRDDAAALVVSRTDLLACHPLLDEEERVTGLAWIVLRDCPFYAEGGGQASDRGTLFLGEDLSSAIQVFSPLFCPPLSPGSPLSVSVSLLSLDRI